MSERNRPDDTIEQRLDRLLDALNAGAPLSGFANDPELRELADAVRAADGVRETRWPDAGFGGRMAARLSAELRHPDHITYRNHSAGARLFDLPDAPAPPNGRIAPSMVTGADDDSGPFDLSIPRRDSRLKMFAQMAAAFAGFAILTFVLVTVFRGAPEDDSAGIAPPAATAETMSFATASPPATASVTATAGDSQIALAPTPPSTPNATLAIVPFELNCVTSAAVTGHGFVPGASVDIFLGDQLPETPDGSAIASIQADDSGAFQFESLVPAGALIPNCEQRAAEGGELSFSAASVIEVDGSQRYAEPAARTPVVLNPAVAVPEMPEVPEDTSATLTLTPDIATCDATVVASGAGFEPGTQVTFLVFQIPGDNGFALEPQPEIGADGAFSVEIDMSGIAPCGMGDVTGTGLPEAGLLYGVSAMTGTGPKPDGDDWREPSAEAILTIVPNAEHASPEALEQLMVDQAVDAARNFLSEPEAEFDVVEVHRGKDRYVRISREVDGAYDEFFYDVDFQRLTGATLQSHASGWAPSAPIDAEQAMQRAVEIASANYPNFADLSLYESDELGTLPGRDGEQDRIFTATWQMQTRTEIPVWLPTVLKVSVNMETGLVTGYHYSFEPYRGSLEPAVAEADAVAAVERAIATEPTLTGATVGEVELTTSHKVLEMDDNGVVISGEWILVWRIYLDNRPETAPGPYIEVDALTGEVFSEFGGPSGHG